MDEIQTPCDSTSCSRHPLPDFHVLFTQSAADGFCSSGNEQEKWKILRKNPNGFRFGLGLFFLLLNLVTIRPVLSQDWDGVVVTQADFQSLQAFKQELDDPKGFLKSWNDSGFGACSGGWVGIKCAKGQVIVIQLPWKGLGGRITDKIGQLQALRKLSLHDNFIGGSIPSSLGLLPNLRGVQLFNNRFSGSIPASLGLCPLLQTLHVSNNLLTGAIPPTLANSTKLYWLNLSFNSFSGSIPMSLTRSVSLTYLDLQHNNLSGSIPDSWGSDATDQNRVFQLKSMALDGNLLSGIIPASLSKLSELQVVSLGHNRLNGGIPEEISRLSLLKTLDVSNNFLNGSMPQSFDSLRNLSVLNLSRNRFNGQIPANLGNISTLKQLDLSQNNLSGQIPASLAELEGLQSLNVSYNNLSGSVPSALAEKFSASSFVGNIQLCGFSGSTPCPSPVPSLESPAPPPESKVSRHRKLSTKDIILIVAGALLLVLVIVFFVLLCCLIRKRAASKEKGGGDAAAAGAARTKKDVPPTSSEVEVGGGDAGGKLVHFDGQTVFTADDLLCATAEIMGKSTYGTVYKATLEDGNQVAVKRLREKITKSQKEFEAEVNILGKVRHPNLLALRAYYLGPKGEKLLVFDYMPNGSLAAFLHARGPDTSIDWPTRMKIAQGMTRGLCHLHAHENSIHGNLTSSNILLDEYINAKIADFGLSRLMTAAASSNVIATAGALGYRAPELSKLKKANTKTDIYSLGVIILELLTGKSPGEAMNGVDLPQWVASIVKEEWTNEVFDLELMRDASSIGDELLNTLKLALHCVDPSPSARPEVQQVLQQLEEIRPETTPSSGDDGAGGGGGPPSTSE
ncbi:putative leucine-rich repeat receptor-like protein kinase IMK3, partial [Cucurbita argyrosperma subsp. sororia]